MTYTYDDNNIFALILRGDIPNNTVEETEHTLAFRDIEPQAPVHVLVIPKGKYVNYDHFAAQASDAEIVDFNRTLAKIVEDEGVAPGGGGEGYRLIVNTGPHGHQDVSHMHVHILGGRTMGRMLTRGCTGASTPCRACLHRYHVQKPNLERSHHKCPRTPPKQKKPPSPVYRVTAAR